APRAGPPPGRARARAPERPRGEGTRGRREPGRESPSWRSGPDAHYEPGGIDRGVARKAPGFSRSDAAGRPKRSERVVEIVGFEVVTLQLTGELSRAGEFGIDQFFPLASPSPTALRVRHRFPAIP